MFQTLIFIWKELVEETGGTGSAYYARHPKNLIPHSNLLRTCEESLNLNKTNAGFWVGEGGTYSELTKLLDHFAASEKSFNKISRFPPSKNLSN